eukprot:m.557542 g.557542  ORF g.557542 m.557542 type:complete len:81 (+) comp57755_c0_seq53:2604-2846(+)
MDEVGTFLYISHPFLLCSLAFSIQTSTSSLCLGLVNLGNVSDEGSLIDLRTFATFLETIEPVFISLPHDSLPLMIWRAKQ